MRKAFVWKIIRSIKQKFFKSRLESFNSQSYWIKRYESGGNSGSGSYNHLAEFKGATINSFIENNSIDNVIEFGCGDGNQLKYFNFENYTGYDISDKIISDCTEKFKHDETKKFRLLKDYQDEIADLTISLDVIYHLIEDDTYHIYMNRLFNSSKRFVIIYSSNTNDNANYNTDSAIHVKHRKFTDWIELNQRDFKLFQHIPNKYQYNGDWRSTSFADFYIFEKAS